MTDSDYIIFIKHELNSTYTPNTNWLNPISLHLPLISTINKYQLQKSQEAYGFSQVEQV